MNEPAGPPPATMMTGKRWGAYVRQRLAAIGDGDGRAAWESEGMTFPSPGTAEIARAWALLLLPDQCPAPSVTPDEDGGIVFTWLNGGWHAELEVRRQDGRADAWLYHRASGTMRNLDMDVARERQELRAHLEELGNAAPAGTPVTAEERP